MATLNNQKLVLSLIKDNLIHTKLLNGLTVVGLDASAYSLNLSETIFELMGFEDNKQSDLIFEHYLGLVEKVNDITILQSHDELDALTTEIYEALLLKI